MAYYKKMEGKRIYLSPMDPEDAEIYTKWMNDKEVSDKVGNSTMLYSEDSERSWIEDNNSEYNFAIINKETDMLIGNCGIQEVSHTFQRAEIGIFIGDKENRGKGYGSEAVSLLLEYCYDTLNLRNVMLKVFSFNEDAIHTYKKLGFKEIGRRREAYYIKGKFWDEVYMDILKEEFDRKFL